MAGSESFFYGNQIGYGVNGFAVAGPGQTITGDFYCIGPLDDGVLIDTAVNQWGGNVNGKTIRVSVFGSFSAVTVSSASTGTLIAYRY